MSCVVCGTDVTLESDDLRNRRPWVCGRECLELWRSEHQLLGNLVRIERVVSGPVPRGRGPRPQYVQVFVDGPDSPRRTRDAVPLNFQDVLMRVEP